MVALSNYQHYATSSSQLLSLIFNNLCSLKQSLPGHKNVLQCSEWKWNLQTRPRTVFLSRISCCAFISHAGKICPSWHPPDYCLSKTVQIHGMINWIPVKETQIKQRVTVLKDPTAIGMNMPYNFGIMRPHGFISQSNQFTIYCMLMPTLCKVIIIQPSDWQTAGHRLLQN